MITDSYLKYLLADKASLYSYFRKHTAPDIEDIKRAMFLKTRDNNYKVPDQFYRLGLEKSFEGLESIADILVDGLFRIADQYLEMRGDRVFVRAERFNDWQLLLPYFPPAVLVASMTQRNLSEKPTANKTFINKYIEPNVKYSALPSPYIRQMIELKERYQGFCDLHTHLNGSTETDSLWQDFLRFPNEVYRELRAVESEKKVSEQYHQLTPYVTAQDFYSLLNIARTLRRKICEVIFSLVDVSSLDGHASASDMLRSIAVESESDKAYEHPLADIAGCDNTLQLEVLMYIGMIDYLTFNKGDVATATLAHYYLLILGLANSMVVQQPDCYGFEEFQKITLNGFREYSEKEYTRRFLQLSGNRLDNLNVLEGRFSPKDDVAKNEALLGKIKTGWDEALKYIGTERTSLPKLRIVAHFIKKAEKKSDIDGQLRHARLRSELRGRTDQLLRLMDQDHPLGRQIAGIDAAAYELDAPPEVFAETFRRCRDKGIGHFTYHAGEDFYHILSGLRVIYEAITYLDLRRGDRIGHATATGIDPELWHNNLGSRILMRQGEYLDDLIFAYHIINERDNIDLKRLLPEIHRRIDALSAKVYGKQYAVNNHIKAWLRRGDEVVDIFAKASEDTTEDVELLFKYHNKRYRVDYERIIGIKPFEIFDAEALRQMQLTMLNYMHRHEIVIETFPTSNVMISHHHDFSTYQLYNWLRWKQEEKPLPPIVVGTDDSGIFATNIYNEYCNIYCYLVYTKEMNTSDVIKFLDELCYNAKLHQF